MACRVLRSAHDDGVPVPLGGVNSVAVVRAGRAEDAALRRLVQLYVYDFSEILPLDLDDDGTFGALPLDGLWDDPRRSVFFVRVGGRLAGFAIVRRGSRLTGDADVWDVEECLVVRRHRRAGVGRAFAAWLFREHPGRWEVRQRREATAATAFWRRAISEFTGDRYAEIHLDDERWRGPVQRFEST